MPTFFVIKELDDGYCWKDFEFNGFAYDYAINVHNIPEEFIEDIEVLPRLEKIEITLSEKKEILQEDWYYCLLRYSA